MRWMIAAVAALALMGCKDDAKGAENAAASAPHGYRMEIRAANNEQIYLVTAPDGRVTAAHAGNGASALMDANSAQRLAAVPTGASNAPEVVSMRFPGFDLHINANKDENGDVSSDNNGQVQLSMGTGNGQRVEINANEGGPGDADDNAHVLVTGADADAARDFINDQDELSPEVKSQMLTAVGLS